MTRAARDRPHLEDASITQLFKSTKVRFTLGKQEIPARPNSRDVRVGDKLKVVQFHSVIRNSVDSITQNNKLRLAPTRCSLDSHHVTNHTVTVREGVITQSRAKSPGAPQTSTLSLCLIEQFNVMLGTAPRHSIRHHLLSSTFSLSSARRFPNGLTHRAEETPNSHILFWMKWPVWLARHHSEQNQKCQNGCSQSRIQASLR